MTKIKVRHGESLDQALRRFNKKTRAILKEVHERQNYVKPSEKKRQEKKELARKIYNEKMRKNR